MGRKYDHTIRRHFVDVDKGDAVYNRARCNYCLKDIAATASTLQRHLNSCRPYKESVGPVQASPATPAMPPPAQDRTGAAIQKRRSNVGRKSTVGPSRASINPGAPMRKTCSLCNADHATEDCWYRANDNNDGTTCEYGSSKYYENEENHWLKQHARLQIEAGNAMDRAIAAHKRAGTGDAELQRRMNDGRAQVNQAVSFGWSNQDYPISAPMPNLGDQA